MKAETKIKITRIIDMYSESQVEYDKFYSLLEQAMIDYNAMVGKKTYYHQAQIETEDIVEEEIIS